MRMCACRGTAGFAHVSCLAEQAKILWEEAEENNLDHKAKDERWGRWGKCSLCEQQYQGVVICALGWACWKTYVGRPETDRARTFAMSVLSNGLHEANHREDALAVRLADLSLRQRAGTSPQSDLLSLQENLATSFFACGRFEESLRMKKDVCSGALRLLGKDDIRTLTSAHNYAATLANVQRFGEAKSVLRETLPVAQRVLGKCHHLTLMMRKIYANTLYEDTTATLDDLREAVTTLEDAERTARRVFGGGHPHTATFEHHLRESRAALRAREE